MLDIKLTRTASPKAKPTDESKLGFGKIFTDHMFLMDYTAGEGWHDARIVPYAPLPLDPATVVFHYAQEIFEGMKAYRTADGTIQLFRPDCNATRFQDSADRLCIPKIPADDFVQAVEALVDVDRDWVPHSDGASLYIRPFCFANDVGLGVHASKHYIFCIICSPSGAYTLGRARPGAGVERGGVELAEVGEIPVLGHLLGAADPFAARRDAVEPEVDEHAEAVVQVPLHALVVAFPVKLVRHRFLHLTCLVRRR